MKNLNYLDEFRINLFDDEMLGDEHNGAFKIRLKDFGIEFKVIASDGGGWEHISVSTEMRCPRWNEMQKIKEMFFEDNETVMQIHPASDNYINIHPFCLHLWRPIEKDIPLPPLYMV